MEELQRIVNLLNNNKLPRLYIVNIVETDRRYTNGAIKYYGYIDNIGSSGHRVYIKERKDGSILTLEEWFECQDLMYLDLSSSIYKVDKDINNKWYVSKK